MSCKLSAPLPRRNAFVYNFPVNSGTSVNRSPTRPMSAT